MIQSRKLKKKEHCKERGVIELETKTHFLTLTKNFYFSQNRKIISNLTLEYFLLESDIEYEGAQIHTYGIGIDSECSGCGTLIHESKCIPDLFSTRQKAEQALNRLAHGEVRPYCLSDVVYEMI